MGQIIQWFTSLEQETSILVATAILAAVVGLIRTIRDLIAELVGLISDIFAVFWARRKGQIEGYTQRETAKRHFRSFINTYTEFYSRSTRQFNEEERDIILQLIADLDASSSMEAILRSNDLITTWNDLKSAITSVCKESVKAKSKNFGSIKGNHQRAKKSAHKFCELAFPEFYKVSKSVLDDRFEKRVRVEFLGRHNYGFARIRTI